MDIVSHGLWASAALTVLNRRRPIARRTAVTTVVLAILPDLFHMLPVVAWSLFGEGSWSALRAYAVALPGQEPMMPPLVELLSHHLHCTMHSAVVAGLVTLVCLSITRSLLVPLLGWWSHIVIDVFTHSADFYPVAVFYPISQRGLDGIAWNSPWFLVLNYLALAGVGVWIAITARRRKSL